MTIAIALVILAVIIWAEYLMMNGDDDDKQV